MNALRTLFIAALAASSAGFAAAQEVNIYSARHYPTDEALYSDFTKATASKSTAWTQTMLAFWLASRPRVQPPPLT